MSPHPAVGKLRHGTGLGRGAGRGGGEIQPLAAKSMQTLPSPETVSAVYCLGDDLVFIINIEL